MSTLLRWPWVAPSSESDSGLPLMQVDTSPAIPVAAMDKDPGSLVGVQGGAAPLCILVPVRTPQTPGGPRVETSRPAFPDSRLTVLNSVILA